MANSLFQWGAMTLAVAIGMGAFGAHGIADPKAAGWMTTGSHYQMIAAVLVATIGLHDARATLRRPAAMLLAGAWLFAATLYAMALGAPRWLGAVTPIGGSAMIIAAVWMAMTRVEKSPDP